MTRHIIAFALVPVDDLDELNVLRSRLRQAKIDVLRIRLGNL